MSSRIRADRLLVDRGLFDSRAKAQAAIAAGMVTADGVPMGSYSVATADQNGGLGGASLGVSGGDTSLYNGNRFGGAPLFRNRSNFSNSATIDGGDTSIYNQFRFGGGSTTNGGTFCP